MDERIQERLQELQAELLEIDDPVEREMRTVYIQAATVAVDVLELITVHKRHEMENDVSMSVSALIAAVSILVHSTVDFDDLEVQAHQLLDAVLRDYKLAYGKKATKQ